MAVAHWRRPETEEVVITGKCCYYLWLQQKVTTANWC